jgi:hypothetical protein
MHRLPCAAFVLALVGATQASAITAPERPPADAANSSVRCAAQHAAHRFVRGSADFDEAMAFLAANASFPSGAARIVVPRTATTIAVSVDLPTACGTAADAAATGQCAAADCDTTAFAPAAFAPGTTLAMHTCADGMHTALSWLAGKDGWLLTRAAQELDPQCDAPG